MKVSAIDRLREIKTFPSLVKYLREELGWPIESDDIEEITYDWSAEELRLDAANAAKIESIKQLIPLSSQQPWGIFFVKFERKRLPIVALRLILGRLVLKRRDSARRADQPAWHCNDLLFISAYGDHDERRISLAHFAEDEQLSARPTLRVLGWKGQDTNLHLDHVADELRTKLRWAEDEEDLESWRKRWSEAFVLGPGEVIQTSKELAVRLADLARRIRKDANDVLRIESERGPLRRLHKAFQQSLIHDLSEDDFADMYAQTVAYGLLAARVSRPAGVIADNLADMVPDTNAFLKEMLSTFLTVGEKKGAIDFDELGIQNVVDLLNSPNTHMEDILRDFGHRTQREDPVMHFYELFLKEYDKKKKVKRGVFYTPQPVVSFIVRSVDEILRTEFSLEDGLADTTTWGEMAKRHKDLTIPEHAEPSDPFVQILDPAAGTGTFLVEVIGLIYNTMIAKWKAEGHMELEFDNLWNDYVPKHLLPRLYGFELMMAPYTVAHMKIALKLFETEYGFSSNERTRIYLTNTLEEPKDISGQLFAEFIAHQAQEANMVKRHPAITVVLGNPPYSVSSQNRGNWIEDKIRSNYYPSDEIKELNPKVLQDDYVKFFQFAELRLKETRQGIVAMITNHGYLDNPTFRRMRQDLVEVFRKIYVLNLHGNSAKKETCPDGSPDQNVFDIRNVGTAIGLYILKRNQKDQTKVFYSDLWGSRDEKYSRLAQSAVGNTGWQKIDPSPLFYLFTPHERELAEEYQTGWRLTDVMPVNSVGIVTARDHFTIDASVDRIWERVNDFIKLPIEVARSKYDLRKDVRDWKVELAQKDLSSTGPNKSRVVPILYRNFDVRYTYYTGRSRGFLCMARPEVMNHLLAAKNLGLIATRQVTSLDYCHVNVTRYPIEYKVGSHDRNTHLFPLYLYPITKDPGQREIYREETKKRSPNLAPEFAEELNRRLGLTFTPDGIGDLSVAFGSEDVFNYIYAVLHSPTYRRRYAHFLKIDFPRVPITCSLGLFRSLCYSGRELVSLHLMESPKLDRHITRSVGDRHTNVEKVSYADQTVWIDKAQSTGFRGVPEDVWNFHIGGYQVCQKWLKDRGPKKGKPGRVLTEGDIAHYHRIVVALSETIRLMKEIDEVIEEHGGWPNAFVTDKSDPASREPSSRG